MKMKTIMISVLCLLLSGCLSVGPDYERLTPPQPRVNDITQTPAGKGTSLQLDKKTLADWWKVFQDPMLSEFIEQALRGNLDMREARAKVREARSQLTIDRADFIPSLDSSASYNQYRSVLSEGSDGQGVRGEMTKYSAGFDASWEIDIFGGTRRAVEAAQADLEAEQASLESVWVSLAGEVAQTYVSIRSYQQRLEVAQGNLKIQEETLAILESRLKAGLSDELDVQQARYNLESSRSTIPTLQSGLESSINSLAVLLGKMPGDLQKQLAQAAPIPKAPFNIVLGIPADTLRQRPDIRVAERNLAAQTARIGEATAELYPKFTLTGSIGLESLKSARLFKSNSESWSILPSVSWPIFHAGSIQANIQVQTAKQEQMLAQYQKAVLTAVKEIRDSLTAFNQEQIRLASLGSAVEAAQTAAEIAQQKYRTGLVQFTEVLDAQRSLFSYDDEMIASQESITNDLISLYKALGGGWQPLRDEPGANKDSAGLPARIPASL